MEMVVTRFENRHDNVAKAKPMSWEGFVRRLSERRISTEKDGLCFCPTEFAQDLNGFHLDGYEYDKKDKDRKKAKIWVNGAKRRITDLDDHILRRNENAQAVHLAVFDFDKVWDPKEIRARFQDFNHVLYSSYSHTDAQPKGRLVLPFKAPLSPEDFKAAWPFGMEIAAEENGWKGADASCKDLARMYFLPACPPETKDQAFFYSATDKKYFAPKIPKASAAPAPMKPPKKVKKVLKDYNSLDGVAWFMAHGAYLAPADGDHHKHHVVCPWRHNHSAGTNNDTEACLYIEPDKWPTFACSHGHCSNRTIKDVMDLWKDQDTYCSKDLVPSDIKSAVSIRALGHDDHGRFYYQCNTTNQVVGLKAGDHKELHLYAITPDENYWRKHYGLEDGKIDWKFAARALIGACQKQGFFKPLMVRGNGVWEDDGRVVAHLGKQLWVEGRPTSIMSHQSEYIYEAMVKNVPMVDPLPQEEMKRVYELANRFALTSDAERMFLAGIVPVGMLSGYLKWRPHLWITGKGGQGKSTILKEFLAPLWRPMGGVITEGVTTEAGLRQHDIRNSAVPVIIDEVESSDKSQIGRVANLVLLARAASPMTDGHISKGTTVGQGMSFTVKCCFVFASVSHSLEQGQDLQRFCVLSTQYSTESKHTFAQLLQDLQGTLTKEYCLAFYAKVIELAPVIRHNAAVFHQAILKNQPEADPRWCDQVGTLMAGACALLYGGEITEEKAWDLYSKLGDAHQAYANKEESHGPRNALNILLAHIVPEVKKSISELIIDARNPNSFFDKDGQPLTGENNNVAKAHLERYGIKVRENCIFVSSNHPQTVALFKNHGLMGHYQLLALIEGAEKGHVQRFGLSKPTKAVKIPLETEEK